MSRTSIPLNDSTKELLSNRKREDETWDEFLIRISTEEDGIEFGAISEEEAEDMKQTVREGRERPE